MNKVAALDAEARKIDRDRIAGARIVGGMEVSVSRID